MSHDETRKLKIIFTGHFAIDTVIRFNQEFSPTLGGSVAYCSLSLREYAKDVDISIISNLGMTNFDDKLLEEFGDGSGIDISGIKKFQKRNTNFVLDYRNHSRSLTLRSKSPNLKFKDIPKSHLEHPPDVVVFVPLCNEISLQYIRKFIRTFPNAYFGIDLQGFIRSFDAKGKVQLIREKRLLKKMDRIIRIIGDRLILKGSEEEIKFLTGLEDLNEIMNYFRKYKGLFIMTLGEKGSLIVKGNSEVMKIPAFKADKVEDETGAGDVYFAIFLYEFLNSDKSWESIKKAGMLASVAASFEVEKKGPRGFKPKEMVLERLKNNVIIEDLS
ncbi:MAG: carbohydrate kinase family protein [Promethearchaeota archaeon]